METPGRVDSLTSVGTVVSGTTLPESFALSGRCSGPEASPQ